MSESAEARWSDPPGVLPRTELLETPQMPLEGSPVRMSASGLFEVAREGTAEQVVLKLSGDIDLASIPPLRAAIDQVVADRRTTHVTFDLDEVDFMDCAGLATLIYVANQMRARAGKTVLINVPPQVDRLVRALDLRGVLRATSTRLTRLPASG